MLQAFDLREDPTLVISWDGSEFLLGRREELDGVRGLQSETLLHIGQRNASTVPRSREGLPRRVEIQLVLQRFEKAEILHADEGGHVLATALDDDAVGAVSHRVNQVGELAPGLRRVDLDHRGSASETYITPIQYALSS